MLSNMMSSEFFLKTPLATYTKTSISANMKKQLLPEAKKACKVAHQMSNTNTLEWFVQDLQDFTFSSLNRIEEFFIYSHENTN